MHMPSTVSWKSLLSMILLYQPLNRFNIMTLPGSPNNLRQITFRLKSGQHLWVLNHKDKATKFLRGILIRHTGTNAFLVEVNGILKLYHKYHSYIDKGMIQEGTISNEQFMRGKQDRSDDSKRNLDIHSLKHGSERMKHKPV